MNQQELHCNSDMVLPPYLEPEFSMCLSPMDLTSFLASKLQKMHGTRYFLKEPEKDLQDYAAVLHDEHWWIGSGN